MKNRELKKQLLDSKIKRKLVDGSELEISLTNDYSHARYNMYLAGLSKDDIFINMAEEYGEENAKALEQMSNAKIKQKHKIKDHIDYLITRGYTLYFITLTFNDNVLNNTTGDTRRKRIQRALSDFADYIFNIDYGSQTEREHFHAVAAWFWVHDGLVENAKDYYASIGRDDIASIIKNKRAVVIKTPGLLNYMKNTGYVYAEPVRTSEKSQNKVSEYVAKLTAHSVKVKQSYVSTKKGTEYQKFQSFLKRLKKINTDDCERLGRYIPLQNTLKSSPGLLDDFHSIDEYSYLDASIISTVIKKKRKMEEARKKYILNKLDKK